MENLSPLSAPRRIPLAIPNPAWLQDHRFMGQAVLPGVWALEHLARAVGRAFPDVALTSCEAVRFDKFLVLPAPAIKAIDAFVDLTPLSDGRIEAALLTRHVAPQSGISRMKTHAGARFGLPDSADQDLTTEPSSPPAQSDAFQVAPDRLYPELVPFGHAFQNIVSSVVLFRSGARARVTGENPEGEDKDAPLRMGSPFPLDAAFHAACAWAQRYRGIVAFPVALQQRLIQHPACFGQHYEAHIRFQGEEGACLLFDLNLRDGEERLCEVVRGLAMRDVSGGELRPPDWIRFDAGAGDPA